MLLTKIKIASLLLVTIPATMGIIFTQRALALQPADKSTIEPQVPIVLRAEGPVDSVAWSPDGKTVATKNRTDRDEQGRFTGSELKLWDARTGKLKRTLFKVGRPLDSVTFSPDGKSLGCTLGGFEDGKEVHQVKLWDPETGQEKATLAGAEHRLHVLAFSPDGSKLACGSAVIDEHGTTTGGEVYLWDVQTGGIDWQKKEHADQINGIAFSGDGKTLASASSDKTIKLWDVKTGHMKRTLSGHDEHGVHSVAFSSDGRTLASGGLDGTVRFWDPATGKLNHTLTGFQKGGIVAVVFSPDGRILASGGSLTSGDERSGAVKLWDAQTGELKRTYPEPLGFVRSIALSPDGQTLAIGSWDQTVTLWRWAK